MADLPNVMLAGLIAHQLEGVTPLDQHQPFCHKSFEFDRAHLVTILVALAAALRLIASLWTSIACRTLPSCRPYPAWFRDGRAIDLNAFWIGRNVISMA